MKHKTLPTLLSVFAIATPLHASTLLLSDNFDSGSYGVSAFNSTLAADQGGTLATVSYTVGNYWEDWQIQHGNGGEMFLVGTAGSGDMYASLDHDFAVDANSYNQPLMLEFDLRINGASDPNNWATFGIGSTQNAFVTNHKFSSLFRENGGTQQFASGGLIGDTATWTSTGSTINVILSDTAETGSAFNGNGSLAKLYVDNVLQGTWSLAQLGVGDGYFSFEANGAFGVYDNLSVSVIPEPGAALLGGLGMLALLRRRR